DVLSVALEDHRITGGACDRARWSASLFLCPKASTTTTPRMKAQDSCLFSAHSPLPFRKGERIEVRDCWHKRNDRSGTLPLPSPLEAERRDAAQGNKFSSTTAVLAAIVPAIAPSVSAQQIPDIAPRAIPVTPIAPATAGPNDIARFLGGMPVPENSPL